MKFPPLHTELTPYEVRPLVLLLDKLPCQWTTEERERWLKAFHASLDMIVLTAGPDTLTAGPTAAAE